MAKRLSLESHCTKDDGSAGCVWNGRFGECGFFLQVTAEARSNKQGFIFGDWKEPLCVCVLAHKNGGDGGGGDGGGGDEDVGGAGFRAGRVIKGGIAEGGGDCGA